MDLESYLRSRREMVEAALDASLPHAPATPTRLQEAIRYSVLAPGKRLRPVLLLASAEAVGGDPRDVLPTACALECIHAFSLIHDDLPCMDDDDYRRGRPTSHRVFGEAVALLAGDALLALAFELVAANAATSAPERVVPALALIARASGTRGMVGGQVLDMESEGRDVDGQTLEYIHAHKTGALLSASAVVGALLCGASEEQLQALRLYGRHIGLAFQIADDILDVVGDESKLGKRVGGDARQGKATYPRLHGLEESRRRACAESERAVEALAAFGPGADPLRAIARYIVERDL
ncbi:MAG: polyprenyl synthetase family protein [Chthonomonadales bacterium]|nr:polyprenyl synthetase family protein [Chthonomonadales bacterium]